MEFDARWLRRLGEDGLAMLLTRRPEATIAPEPTSLTQLAQRLCLPGNVLDAMRRLDLPTLQVAEAIAGLGGVTDRDVLDRLLGVTGPAVDRALTTLVEHGLLISGGDGRLRLVDAARAAFGDPLGLSAPAATLVALMTVDDMKLICSRLGVRPPARKAEVVATLLAALRDADRIRSIVDDMPATVAELLERLAETGEGVTDYGYYGPSRQSEKTPLRWAADRGLLMRAHPWGDVWIMPAEVAIALRGPDYHAGFDPEPPTCARNEVHAATVARDAAAAAGSFLRLASSVLEGASRSRITLLRGGGVGVRELKRLAKAHGATPDAVRLALGVAFQAGLLTASAGTAAPTERYDRWLKQEPADRLAELLVEWWLMVYAPTAGSDGSLTPPEYDQGSADVRATVLHHAAAESGAPAKIETFLDFVFWHRPAVLAGGPDIAMATAVAAWAEATTLGVIGAGAVSEAGRALLDGDQPALAAALAGIGSLVRTAHLQADLTAVVTGTPSPALTEVLDGAADRESTAAAATWRFSPGSIRRALDAGQSADGLISDLKGVAANSVPQTLEYLVRDVARRHGAVRAREVVCCLRGEDTSLLAEMVADRKLRALDLRLLAPTVVASVKPLAETLAALRGAGYAPVEESADGTAVVEQIARNRAKLLRPAGAREAKAYAERLATARLRAIAPTVTPDTAERVLATALLGRQDPAETVVAPGRIRDLDDQLAELMLLNVPTMKPDREDYRPRGNAAAPGVSRRMPTQRPAFPVDRGHGFGAKRP